MSWDEKAEDHAVAHHTYEHLGYGENMRFHRKFVAGAKWQRDQLRTDEAVERAAKGILHSDWPADQEDRDYHWKHFADSYRDRAREAITALLGED